MSRCFIAIDLPDNIKHELVLLQKELVHDNLFFGKLVESENLHLTLAFLGEISDTVLVRVRMALSSISFKKFDLKLAEVGVFTPISPRVLWVALRGALVFDLQKQIQNILQPLVQLDNKPFVSHVTLARIKHVKDPASFAHVVQHTKVKPLIFCVSEFVLKQSQLTSDGPIYHVIERYHAQESSICSV